MRLPYYAIENTVTPNIAAVPARARSKNLTAQQKFYNDTVHDGLTFARWVRANCPGGFYDGLVEGLAEGQPNV